MTLDDLIGEWDLAVGGEVGGLATFTWELGGAYVAQRGDIFVEGPPNSLCLLQPTDDGHLQHYFDSRGVSRVYRGRFEGDTWILERTEPDFSPLPFTQRFVGEHSGDAIDARWEQGDGDGGWKLDFELTYRRR